MYSNYFTHTMAKKLTIVTLLLKAIFKNFKNYSKICFTSHHNQINSHQHKISLVFCYNLRRPDDDLMKDILISNLIQRGSNAGQNEKNYQLRS